jgi:hypothetical protein
LPRLIRSLKVLVNKLGYSRVAICWICIIDLFRRNNLIKSTA